MAGPVGRCREKAHNGSYVLAELDGTVFCIIPYHQHDDLTFRLDEFLKPIGVDEAVEVEENEEAMGIQLRNLKKRN
jgi:hypothetical protein